MRKNPLNISFDDLIEAASKRLEWMESEYPSKLIVGQITQWTATHNLECQKTLVRLLKRCKRKKQMDLFEEFKSMK